MHHIEPGEPFDVEYGNGKKLKAVGLAFRQQRKVLQLLVDGDEGTQVQKFDAAENALKICFPGITDEQIDSLNYNMACEAIGKAIASTRLSEDEQKKSE